MMIKQIKKILITVIFIINVSCGEDKPYMNSNTHNDNTKAIPYKYSRCSGQYCVSREFNTYIPQFLYPYILKIERWWHYVATDEIIENIIIDFMDNFENFHTKIINNGQADTTYKIIGKYTNTLKDDSLCIVKEYQHNPKFLIKPPIIYLHAERWASANESERILILLHALGHCYLFLDDTNIVYHYNGKVFPDSIMNVQYKLYTNIYSEYIYEYVYESWNSLYNILDIIKDGVVLDYFQE